MTAPQAPRGATSPRKKISEIFKKRLDRLAGLWYNNLRKREEDNDMTPDYWEAHEAEWLEEQELLAELAAEEA